MAGKIDFLTLGGVTLYPVTLTNAIYSLDGSLLETTIDNLKKQIDGKQPSGSYSLTSHNHDSVYAKISHTHNYLPQYGDTSKLTYGSPALYLGQYEATTKYGGISKWMNAIKILHGNPSGYFTEIGQDFDGELYRRSMVGGVLGNFVKVMDASNISDYGYLIAAKHAETASNSDKLANHPISDFVLHTTYAKLENIELSMAKYGGFIDFHYDRSTDDYTSRIIEDGKGRLSVNNMRVYRTYNPMANAVLSIAPPTGDVIWAW